ncbi:hypothetical protein [Streptomyces sp. NPDC059918]|uniref:hypothetical protein n=1 Tax=unclassified Streptomyces TaxID=2593676 RepID=UPI003662C97A
MPNSEDTAAFPAALRAALAAGVDYREAKAAADPWMALWDVLRAVRDSGELTERFAAAVDLAQGMPDHTESIEHLRQYLWACLKEAEECDDAYWPGTAPDSAALGTGQDLVDFVRFASHELNLWRGQLWDSLSPEEMSADVLHGYPGSARYALVGDETFAAARERAAADPLAELDRVVGLLVNSGFVSSGEPGDVVGFFADPSACRGDCSTLTSACTTVLDVLGIPSETRGEGLVLVGNGEVRGRTPNAVNPRTGRREWWVFAEHYWVAAAGVERDLLFGGVAPATLKKAYGTPRRDGSVQFDALVLAQGEDGVWVPHAPKKRSSPECAVM